MNDESKEGVLRGDATGLRLVRAENVKRAVASLRSIRSHWVKGEVKTGTFDDPMTLGGVTLDEAIFGTTLSSPMMDRQHVVGRVKITVEWLDD